MYRQSSDDASTQNMKRTRLGCQSPYSGFDAPVGFIFPPRQHFIRMIQLNVQCHRRHTSGSINDKQDNGHKTKKDDCTREHGASRPSFDERCNENSTDALCGLVDTLSSANWQGDF